MYEILWRYNKNYSIIIAFELFISKYERIFIHIKCSNVWYILQIIQYLAYLL